MPGGKASGPTGAGVAVGSGVTVGGIGVGSGVWVEVGVGEAGISADKVRPVAVAGSIAGVSLGTASFPLWLGVAVVQAARRRTASARIPRIFFMKQFLSGME
jgi:hypothetical protein